MHWLIYIFEESPLSSSVPAPGISIMDKEFHNTSQILSTLTISIFVLGFAVSFLPKPILLHSVSQFRLYRYIYCTDNKRWGPSSSPPSPRSTAAAPSSRTPTSSSPSGNSGAHSRPTSVPSSPSVSLEAWAAPPASPSAAGSLRTYSRSNNVALQTPCTCLVLCLVPLLDLS